MVALCEQSVPHSTAPASHAESEACASAGNEWVQCLRTGKSVAVLQQQLAERDCQVLWIGNVSWCVLAQLAPRTLCLLHVEGFAPASCILSALFHCQQVAMSVHTYACSATPHVQGGHMVSADVTSDSNCMMLRTLCRFMSVHEAEAALALHAPQAQHIEVLQFCSDKERQRYPACALVCLCISISGSLSGCV